MDSLYISLAPTEAYIPYHHNHNTISLTHHTSSHQLVLPHQPFSPCGRFRTCSFLRWYFTEWSTFILRYVTLLLLLLYYFTIPLHSIAWLHGLMDGARFPLSACWVLMPVGIWGMTGIGKDRVDGVVWAEWQNGALFFYEFLVVVLWCECDMIVRFVESDLWCMWDLWGFW